MNNASGVTFTLVFGAYGGFHFRYSYQALGICLGYVAFTIYMYNLENVIKILLDRCHTQTKQKEID